LAPYMVYVHSLTITKAWSDYFKDVLTTWPGQKLTVHFHFNITVFITTPDNVQ